MNLFKWSILIIIIVLFHSCEVNRDRAKTAFGFLFKGDWDSLRNYIEKPCEELDFIISSSSKMTALYQYSVQDTCLLFGQVNATLDTIYFRRNKVSGKIEIDSIASLKLFSREKEIRKNLVSHFIHMKRPREAWLWLVHSPRLEIDSLYGNLFAMMYYAFDPGEFAEVIPNIEQAWSSGHLNSGLALSYWLSLNGNRDESIKILKTLAGMNNTEAMVRLGEIYEDYYSEFGYDPPKEAKPWSSFQWYRRAASLNNPFAMFQLGFIYERGINRKRMIDSAFYWYRKSSNLGDSFASSALAVLFMSGDGVKEDKDSAMFWFNRAIGQDPAIGYMNLGEVYEEGIVVDQNLELAMKYYSKADSSGSSAARLAILRLRKTL